MELGFVGALKDTRQTYLKRIANDLIICELAALVNDLLSLSGRLIHVPLTNQRFNIRNLIAFLYFKAERLLSYGRWRYEFDLNHVLFYHILLLFQAGSRFVILFNHGAFLLHRHGRCHASGELKSWLWLS